MKSRLPASGSSPSTTPARAARSRRETPGCIEPGVLYTLAELSVRLHLGSWALRRARRSGLKVLRAHGRSFILGSDFIAYAQQAAGGEDKT